ncbi:MAG: NAD-dependent deacylase [Spirochaetia bacterium]|nr:NAD-dependent deacylase [Spirochaetia bacterium]
MSDLNHTASGGREQSRFDPFAYRNVVVLTGAGVSVASGIRPYRGPGGLWNDATLARLADIETFVAEPLEVWRHWWKLRELARGAEPNPAHLALAAFERSRSAGSSITLVTQNVDGLHGRAGSRALVEYHGNALRTRCSNPRCSLEPYDDRTASGDAVPRCPRCGANLRPDIVLFGESIPEAAREAVERALAACDLFVAIGTSATVYPAALFVDIAKRRGARTVYLNLQGLDALGGSGDFDEEILGPAELLAPRYFAPGAGASAAAGGAP